MKTGLTPALLSLFRELSDLKRIHSAEHPGSIAERLFGSAWAALIAGDDPAAVMAQVGGAALAAARLGDLDLATLRGLGVAAPLAVLERSFDEAAVCLHASLRDRLRMALAAGVPRSGPVPDFAARLARQPRAGVTCPGRPRVILQPAENHAEHCLMAAVYAVVVSPCYGADPAEAFLAAMAHHLHNAFMPDSGFAGEVLLGGALDGVVASARDKALAQIPAPLSAWVCDLLRRIKGDADPVAMAFHAGDVLDRVLEIEQHLRASHLHMDRVTGEYGLVHEGPVKALHDRILADAGLA